MKRFWGIVLITLITNLVFAYIPSEDLILKGKCYHPMGSLTLYIKLPDGSPAANVAVVGYYTNSIWSGGTNRFYTDDNGRVVLTWSGDKKLTVIWVFYRGYNYYFYGEYSSGSTYTLVLDESHKENKR